MQGSNGQRHASAVRAAGLALRVDSVTSEVVTAMRDAGIPTLLLKGPSIDAWLYDDRAVRPYDDTDLLVAPSAYRRAGDVLRELGFRPADAWHREARMWLRRPDTTYVDLHRSLFGVFAPPDTLWRELAAHPDTLRVGGTEVDVLRIPARALHVALHAGQHGVDAERPLEDLARAIRVADEGVWREAGELARRIDALPAFAAGLRLDPEGARIAERLKLPGEQPPIVALSAAGGGDVPVAIALESLAGERSLRARAHLLSRALAPSPLYIRRWSAMHMTRLPAAVRRGTVGLWVAYLWRPIWILLQLPKAIAAVRHARQARAEG